MAIETYFHHIHHNMFFSSCVIVLSKSSIHLLLLRPLCEILFPLLWSTSQKVCSSLIQKQAYFLNTFWFFCFVLFLWYRRYSILEKVFVLSLYQYSLVLMQSWSRLVQSWLQHDCTYRIYTLPGLSLCVRFCTGATCCFVFLFEQRPSRSFWMCSSSSSSWYWCRVHQRTSPSQPDWSQDMGSLPELALALPSQVSNQPVGVEGILRWHAPAHDGVEEGFPLAGVEPEHLGGDQVDIDAGNVICLSMEEVQLRAGLSDFFVGLRNGYRGCLCCSYTVFNHMRAPKIYSCSRAKLLLSSGLNLPWAPLLTRALGTYDPPLPPCWITMLPVDGGVLSL